jgi:hypothetical protein
MECETTVASSDYKLRARVAERREVAKGTLLVIFDLLGEEVEFPYRELARKIKGFAVERLDRQCAPE